MKHNFSLNKFRMLSVLLILALISGYASASPASAATTYTLTDLGTLGGFSDSFARAINEAGQVIGNTFQAGTNSYRAFLWEGGVMTDLGTFGGLGVGDSFAYDINEAGQVVGQAYSADYEQIHAFLWEGGVMTDLAPYEGFDSRAGLINEAGQVLGAIDLDGEFIQAFVWKDGVLTRLLLSGHNSQAAGMNEAGQVIGYADTFDSTGNSTGDHAFLWENGVMIDLGTFGGGLGAPSNTDSYPTAINEAGQVVGYAYLSNGDYHAFLWQGGVMTDLGTFGGSSSQANAINEAGQVVGSAYTTGDAEKHAFLWQGGVLTDLGTLGGSESVAYGINEAGQVIGYSYLAGDTERHPFVWEGGVMTDLTLGGSDGQTVAINEAGQVIGYSTLAGDAERHAFVWQSGVMTDLGTLGGSTSDPFAINEAGQVIGYSYVTDNISYHAFVTMSVTNQPPTTDAGGPYSVDEGASVTVNASGNDPEGGALVYAWDLDNNGTFETPGQSATFSAVSLAGPSSHTIAVQVTDDGGLTATDQATVNVLDVATPTPQAQLSILTTEVNDFVAGGDISSGVGTALLSKLQTAQKKLDSSQTNTTINVLNAFMNSVEAQRGKKISAAAADDLMAQAQTIIEQLQQ
ncbi:MAG TPA: PKD domain-containing protein [Anaerolineales bacterium]|nr:PKD domain-containing protein [Anaerolineales bacterium]